jgi:hypothetical protein
LGNWEQNIQQDDVAQDLNQAPVDLALKANLIAPQQQASQPPQLNFDLNEVPEGQVEMLVDSFSLVNSTESGESVDQGVNPV